MKQTQLTKEGFKTLKIELDELTTVKRPKIVERLEYARGQGDLTENVEYQTAREELDFMDGRIDELKGVLENAQIVAGGKSSKKSGEVGVGTRVTVGVNGSKHIYEIVGEWEADPQNKKISPESPLGQALVGKKIGEAVDVEAPAGKVNYKILAIE
ncbi:MAG: transcription elongation factor GreA [Patescibacteria group bacterium]|mgnify:CR=1 FL=1